MRWPGNQFGRYIALRLQVMAQFLDLAKPADDQVYVQTGTV